MRQEQAQERVAVLELVRVLESAQVLVQVLEEVLGQAQVLEPVLPNS